MSILNNSIAEDVIASTGGADTDSGLTGAAVSSAEVVGELTTSIPLAGDAQAQVASGPTSLHTIIGVETFSATFEQIIYEFGSITATLEQQITADVYSLKAQIQQVVYEAGTISTTVEQQIVDYEVGTLSISLEIQVYTTGTIAITVEQQIYDPDSLFPIAGDTQLWAVKVYLEDIDVSASITGLVTVDAEEGSARIATFVLRPTFGPISITSWVNKPVRIDYQLATPGGTVTRALFVGRVDTPEYDPNTRLTTFKCSDFLQKRWEQSSRKKILADLGGYWSSTVFDEHASNVDYANDVLSTIPASYDLTVDGVGRLTYWHTASAQDFTFSEAHIMDRSLTVELASSRSVLNQLELEVGFRFDRIHEQHQRYYWDFFLSSFSLSWNDVGVNGIPLPTTGMIQDAIKGVDWPLVGAPVFFAPPSYTEYYTTSSDGSLNVGYLINPPGLCIGANFTLAKRWAQQITERSRFVVKAPQSIEQMGLVREERSYAYEPDPSSHRFYNVFEETWNKPYVEGRVGSASVVSQQFEPADAVAGSYVWYRYPFPSAANSTDYGKYVDLDDIQIVNLLPSPETFSTWSGSAGVIDNVDINLDGEAKGAKLFVYSGTYRETSVNVESAATYTASVYLKTDAVNSGRTTYLTASDDDGVMEAVVCHLSTQWARYSVTLTTGQNADTLTLRIGEGDAAVVFADRAMVNEGPLLEYTSGTGKSSRQLAQEAIVCAQAQARTSILASHRQNYVQFQTTLNPLLERFHKIRIDTETVQATGKVKQITHEMDTLNGAALTTVRLAISKVVATSVPDETVLSAPAKAVSAPVVPDADEAYSVGRLGTWIGFLENEVPGAPYDYASGINGTAYLSHDPIYGYIADATSTRYNFDLSKTYYGYGEPRFVIGTPAIHRSNTDEIIRYNQDEVIVAIPDDELVMAA